MAQFWVLQSADRQRRRILRYRHHCPFQEAVREAEKDNYPRLGRRRYNPQEGEARTHAQVQGHLRRRRRHYHRMVQGDGFPARAGEARPVHADGGVPGLRGREAQKRGPVDSV